MITIALIVLGEAVAAVAAETTAACWKPLRVSCQPCRPFYPRVPASFYDTFVLPKVDVESIPACDAFDESSLTSALLCSE